MTKPVIPALPQDAVDQIWKEVFETHNIDPAIIDFLKAGSVALSVDILDSFVQAAMEYPHFAAPRDITHALSMDARVISNSMSRVRQKARESRI